MYGLGCRAKGFQGLGFRVYGSGFRNLDLGPVMVIGRNSSSMDLGCMAQGVQGLGSRLQALGSRV